MSAYNELYLNKEYLRSTAYVIVEIVSNIELMK